MRILCLAEDSLETSSLIFSEKTMKKYFCMSSAAVVIGALRVKLNNVFFIAWRKLKIVISLFLFIFYFIHLI